MSSRVRIPDPISLPAQAVREWIELPELTELDVKVSRLTVDHFYFSINKMIESQHFLQQSLIHYSNGEIERANSALQESQANLAESSNRLRQFMTDVMLSATRGSAG